MDSVRHLVVGGGISGLAFADRLNDDDVLVLERDEELGGYCKTVHQDGFVWDYSGHFFHFRHPEIERELVARMNDQKILVVAKDSRIWFADAWVDFPFQKNIHQLPKADFAECLHDLHFKDRAHPAAPKSFLEMLYAKFGRGIAERFLIPYNEKLYATDLGRLDVEAMGRFFPYANVDEIVANFVGGKDTSYNATFTYPEGGAIQYVHALASELEPSRIVTGEEVLGIDLRRKVARTSRREVRFENLVSAVPFPSLLRLCGIPFDDSFYTWNVVEVFNLGFDRKGPKDIHWAYYPQRDLSFYRVGFYDNIFGSDRMSIYVEIGRPQGYRTTPEAREETLSRVLEDLRRVGLVDGHRLVSHHHVLLDPAYVHVTRASQRDVEEKKRALATRGVFSIGRYGSWTYCSIEDNIVEARALADACNLAAGVG